MEMRGSESIKISRLPLGPCVVYKPRVLSPPNKSCEPVDPGGETMKNMVLTFDAWHLLKLL